MSRGDSFANEPISHSPLSPTRSKSSTPIPALSGRVTPKQDEVLKGQEGQGEGECDGGCEGCHKTNAKDEVKEW